MSGASLWVMTATEVYHRRAYASSFAAGVPDWDVGGHHGEHSIAMRPRVAARSPMIGAPLPATEAAERGRVTS